MQKHLLTKVIFPDLFKGEIKPKLIQIDNTNLVFHVVLAIGQILQGTTSVFMHFNQLMAEKTNQGSDSSHTPNKDT